MSSDPARVHPAGAGAGTVAVHAGRRPDPVTGAALPPIVQSTTYVQDDLGVDRGYTYSRTRNPTVTALEEALAAHEGAACATAWASGMAAVTGLALAALRAGDHAVCSRSLYGGTVRLFERVLASFGVTVTFADARRPDAVAGAVRERTRLILLETPGNPTLDLADVSAAAGVAREAGALLAVDNTFLTGVLQRPLELGADVVVHSTTKFLDGHNAVVGGALVTDDPELDERLRFVRKTVGSIQSPFGAWLTHQGLTTLPLRMERHSATALAVAGWLALRSGVRRVLYPFLPDFPQHELARRQQRSGGGVLAFELTGGEEAARDLFRGLRLCRLAESLGAAQTLATHPVSMTHADVSEELRRSLGVTPGLVRLSVGLEDPEDLIADLDRALGTRGDRPGAGRSS
ncbi:MAG: trans-sulfuration enzyme family protein [Thermoanaerobaculia bacterium]